MRTCCYLLFMMIHFLLKFSGLKYFVHAVSKWDFKGYFTAWTYALNTLIFKISFSDYLWRAWYSSNIYLIDQFLTVVNFLLRQLHQGRWMVINIFRFIIRVIKRLIWFHFQIECTSRMYAERIFIVTIIEEPQRLKILIIYFLPSICGPDNLVNMTRPS